MESKPTTGKGMGEYFEIFKDDMPEKLQTLRQKLYQKAKNEPKFRFYTLYGHVSREDVLQIAWKLVKRNGGAAGIDGKSIEDIEVSEGGVEKFLEGIRIDLQERRYKPGPVRRVYIPKPQGGERPLGIPNVRDRVVQAAVRLILEPIFEADFMECSYGFRPGKSAHDALAEVQKYLKAGEQEVYDIDIKGYFDNIPHDKLLISIQVRVADPMMMKLIEMWLKAPIISKDKEGKGSSSVRPNKGTPQGGVISPLLANIYLHWMDKAISSPKSPAQRVKAKIVRYADDMVIIAHEIGPQLKEYTKYILEERLGLTMNTEKTKIVKLKEQGSHLDFLGYTFRLDRDLKGRPWRYVNIEPSKRSLKRIRARLKERTTSRYCYKPTTELIADVNRTLACWKPYFTFGYPRRVFRLVNHYVCQRLIIHLRRRSQRPFRPVPGMTYYDCLQHLGLQLL